MTLVKEKPTSPGRRFVIRVINKELHKGSPYKALLDKKNKHHGRNNKGRITMRHRGGGHKQRYRIIDFRRSSKLLDIPATVERLEYDPNRSANIALLLYKNGKRSYILAPKDITVGQTVISGSSVPIRSGNCLPIRNIPVGSIIHSIEMIPGKGAQLVRSAGTSARLVSKENDIYSIVRLSSGETRKILMDCKATIGEVSNGEHNLRQLGKAGVNRWRGRRPGVRGVAMNPIDHPHGGGEGRSSGGRHPVSPWGQPTKGYKTRTNKRTSKMIIKRRK